jgi:uncharacterized protein YqgC (DUF456 family)
MTTDNSIASAEVPEGVADDFKLEVSEIMDGGGLRRAAWQMLIILGMSPFITSVLIVGLLVALAVGWLLTLLTLPGNWLMVAAAVLYAWLVPDQTRWDLSWQLVGALTVLAILGEIIESTASAARVRKLGGSRRSAVLSIVFSIIGALIGTATIPIPIVGTLAGACLGAMAGAMFGETWKGSDSEMTGRVGRAAFWGRLYGSLAKVTVACVMVAVVVAGLFVR